MTNVADGEVGKGYDGILLEKTTAQSVIECVSQCSIRPGCCVAEFEKSSEVCELNARPVNGNETFTGDIEKHVSIFTIKNILL